MSPILSSYLVLLLLLSGLVIGIWALFRIIPFSYEWIDDGETGSLKDYDGDKSTSAASAAL